MSYFTEYNLSITLHPIFLLIFILFILNVSFFKIEKCQNDSICHTSSKNFHFYARSEGRFEFAAGMGKLENNLFSLSQTERRKGHNISRNSYIPLTRQIADGGCTCVFVCGQRGWWTRRKLYH